MKKKAIEIIFVLSICSMFFTGCQNNFSGMEQDNSQDLEENEATDESPDVLQGNTPAEILEDSSGDEDGDLKETNPEENQETENNSLQETVISDNSIILYEPEFEEEWQVAYADVLQEELEKAGSDRFSAYYQDEELASDYSLYDIDKDQIPELIIHRGNCEANAHSTVYTYRDGLKEIDVIYLGHTTLYTYPNENGMLSCMGHSGYACIDKCWIEDGSLHFESIFEESMYDEEGNYIEGKDYTNPNEIVEGARMIDCYPLSSLIALEYYTQKENYINGEVIASDNLPQVDMRTSTKEQAEDFYSSYLEDDGLIYVTAIDRYMNNPQEYMTYSHMLEEDIMYPYISEPLSVTQSLVRDLDGNGSYEYIVYFIEGDDTFCSYRVIFNLQDDVVYAYLSFLAYENTITEDGTFMRDEGNFQYNWRVLFDHDSCFEFYCD